MSAPKQRGFTLIELASVAAVTLLLFALVTTTFFRSQDAVGHTVDKVEAVQNARHLVNKLAPLVSVACDPSQLGGHPVRIRLPVDGLDPEMKSPTWLDITSTEDFLVDGPQRRDEFLPLSQIFAFLYRAEYLPDEGQLVLRKMMPDGSTVDTSVQPRIIASNIDGLQFRPVITDESLIEVRVRIKQQQSGRKTGERHFVESAATLHIPAESLR